MKRARDEGAALLTVLLLVAVMSALIAVSFDRVGIAIARERNRSLAAEARLDLISAEAIAVAQANRVKAEAGTDASQWHGRTITTPVPNGVLKGRIVDGGNCFNLNGLVTRAATGELVAHPVAIGQFAHLLELLGLSANAAAQIASASADWIDSDQLTLPGGSEDDHYLRDTRPTRTAGELIRDPAEWRLVNGVSDTLWRRAEPLLCALPEATLPGYNINALLPWQAPLIAAILPRGATPEQVVAALANRPAAGFGTYQDMLIQPSLRGFTPPPEANVQLRLKTDWFRLESMVTLGDSDFSAAVLIDARVLPARAVQRQFGAF